MLHDTEPLYERIVADIRRKISSGELVSGVKIWSISELSRSYCVSPMTAVRAVRKLKELGLVQAVKRKGLYVTHAAVAQRATLSEPQHVARVVMFGNRNLQRRTKDAFYGSIVDSIFSRVSELGLDFKLEQFSVERLDAIVTPPLRLQPGDGVIVISGKPNLRLLAQLEEQKVPYVLVDGFVAGCRCVTTHNIAGMRQAVEHLYALGHRRLVLMTDRYPIRNPLNEAERALGFWEAATWRGLEARQEYIAESSQVRDLMKSRQRPTAFLFTQDVPALTFVRQLTKAGYRVPQDASVVGFDDYAGDQKGLDRLTTLRVDRSALGRAALDLLLDSAGSNRNPMACLRVAPTLIVRSSTGPVRRRTPSRTAAGKPHHAKD